MSVTRESSPTNYFPVRRIAQACVSCRRKKSRCTGDRPRCGHCRRLKLDCVYPDKPAVQLTLTDKAPDEPICHEVSSQDPVERRLAAIENTLQNFGDQLQTISQLLTRSSARNGLDTRESPTPAEPPHKKARIMTENMTYDLDYDDENNSAAPGEAQAPKEVLLSIVDTYFTYCHNQPYSFFHEGDFRRRLTEGAIPEHLVLAILASAVRFARHPYFAGSSYEASVEYANRSWKSVVSNCFTVSKPPDVSIVQTIALLALFDFTAGQSRHGSAWVKIGMAVRIAQDLGLMLDAAPHLPYSEQEERRRVFWSIYLLDRLVSCGRGRPPAIVDASCHLQLPSEESIWKHGLWKKTLTLDELSNRSLLIRERQGDYAHVIVMAYTLGRGAQYMLQEFNIRSRYPPWDSNSDFAAIESDLLHLQTQLQMEKPVAELLAPHIGPHGVDHQRAGPIIFSRAFFHLCYCMLNHPFLLRERLETTQVIPPASFLSHAFKTGWQHAQHMIELIRNARGLGCKFQSSFSGYCTVVAGSIAALYTHSDDPIISTAAHGLLFETIGYLEDVGQYWNNVSIMAQVLQQTAENALVFRQLCSNQPQILPLSPADTEVMWSLVDYSTMSNESSAGLMQNQSLEANLWFDSWFDLFGNMDYRTDFGVTGGGLNDLDSAGG